jgi:hypothetical protein
MWSSAPMRGYPYGIQIADVDADGLMDILASCQGIQLFKNTGTDFLHEGAVIAETPGNPFIVADLDGDDFVDIAHGSPYSNGNYCVRLYRQDPATHTFSFADTLAGKHGSNLVVGLRYNADDLLDIVAAETYSGEVRVYQNDGDFKFHEVFFHQSEQRVAGLAAGDFDNDNFDDIVYCPLAEELPIFKNLAGSGYRIQNSMSQTGLTHVVVADDLDRDSNVDIIGGEVFGGNLSGLKNRGEFAFDKFIYVDTNLDRIYGVAIGDYDNNGIKDIAYGYNPIHVLFDAPEHLDFGSIVTENEPGTQRAYILAQNYPNPFNPSTTIEYTVAVRGHVKIEIYDMLGKRVRTLVDGLRSGGCHRVIWNGLDDGGSQTASGVYFYKMTSGRSSEIRKLLKLK